MSQLNDAKLLTLRTQLALEGHINDLEDRWLVALGATPGQSLVDMLWEVFNAAGIAPGQFNDRAVAYIIQVTTPPGSLGSYNNHWLYYWENATLGPPPPVAPPALPNLQHWFKWDDPLTTWQDTVATAGMANTSRPVVDKSAGVPLVPSVNVTGLPS